MPFMSIATKMAMPVLYLDGESIVGCPEQHRKEGDNHVGFQAGTNPKFFCIKNVKINDESAD